LTQFWVAGCRTDYNFLGRNDSRFAAAARDGLLAPDASGQPHPASGGPNETAMWDVYNETARAAMMAGVTAGKRF
jgi:hypothetical protein